MPISVEVKVEYLNTWPGRLLLIEIFLGILCMSCAAPAYFATQHWFLLVAVIAFIGTWYYLFYHLFLDTYVQSPKINWLQIEFWFFALTTFLYFTAFLAQLVDFSGITSKNYQYWYDAQVAAGVFGLFIDIAYGLSTYLVYIEWRSAPAGGLEPPVA